MGVGAVFYHYHFLVAPPLFPPCCPPYVEVLEAKKAEKVSTDIK